MSVNHSSSSVVDSKFSNPPILYSSSLLEGDSIKPVLFRSSTLNLFNYPESNWNNFKGSYLQSFQNFTVDNPWVNESGRSLTDPRINQTWLQDGESEAVEITGMLVLAGLALYFLAFSTAVGNALVIHAIRTDKRLQTVSNMFIMSLASADLTVGLIVMPISAAYFVVGEWRWGTIVCQLWLIVDYTASTASIFNLVILSLDRYWSVSNPLRYLHKRTRKRAMILIGCSWAAAALWLVPLLAWHHIVHEGRRQHESHVCETEFSDSIAFKIITSALNFYGPSALMVYLYYCIFQSIKQRSTDLLGTMAPMEQQTSQLPSTANIQRKQTYRNLTVVAYPEQESEQDLSTAYYKGVSVEVEYVGDSLSSSENYGRMKHLSKCSEHDGSFKNNLLSTGRIAIEPPSPSPSRNHSIYHKNHQHHLACYPCSPSAVWAANDLPSTASGVSDGDQNSSFRNNKSGFAGLRGLLRERRNVASTSSASSSDRRNDPLNIVKEKKAARQLGVIMGAFFACWIPYFTLFPIIAFCDDCIPARMHLAAIWLGYLNSTLNPMIYPLCNQNFRRAFARMLRCRRSSRQIPSVSLIPV